jgi:hypothetical protein
MTDKYALYPFLFPFRSRLQRRLREERKSVDMETFVQALSADEQHAEAARVLWELLRQQAFVPDFRPDPNDDLSKVNAMGPEEVRDDVIDPLLDRLGLSVSGIDFTGFDFSSVATPRDVIAFVMKVADAQNSEGKRRFVDMAR